MTNQAKRTRWTIDQERYTRAMFLLGYSTAFIRKLVDMIPSGVAKEHKLDFEWFTDEIAKVMGLNEEAGVDDDTPEDAAQGPEPDDEA